MQTKPLQEVWPGVEAFSWCVVWVAPVTAGMDEDTQRELFRGEKQQRAGSSCKRNPSSGREENVCWEPKS